MEALHVESKQNTINAVALARKASLPKKTDKQNFYTQAQQLTAHYSFVKDEFNNEQKIIGFALFHDLIDFLLWINQAISEVFGETEKTLELYKDWDEEDYHLVLTICSNLEDLDEMMLLEKKLFNKLKSYKALDNALHYIVISQD